MELKRHSTKPIVEKKKGYRIRIKNKRYGTYEYGFLDHETEKAVLFSGLSSPYAQEGHFGRTRNRSHWIPKRFVEMLEQVDITERYWRNLTCYDTPIVLYYVESERDKNTESIR